MLRGSIAPRQHPKDEMPTMNQNITIMREGTFSSKRTLNRFATMTKVNTSSSEKGWPHRRSRAAGKVHPAADPASGSLEASARGRPGPSVPAVGSSPPGDLIVLSSFFSSSSSDFPCPEVPELFVSAIKLSTSN